MFQTITVENPAALGNRLVAIEASNSVGSEHYQRDAER